MSSADKSAENLLSRAYGVETAQQSRRLYRDWAATYDRTMLKGLGYVSPRRAARMLADALPIRPAVVLDVGCGTGLAAIELARYPWLTIDGLDFSPEMLTVAARRGIYRALFAADLNRPLRLPAHRYDALICTGTFTHGHVGAGCLPELFRILRPGGRFAGTIHRDVYEPLGFAEAIGRMASSGKIRVVRHEAGGYYAGSAEPEGYYFLWRKS